MWVLKFNKKEEDAAEVQKKMGNESKTPRLFLIALPLFCSHVPGSIFQDHYTTTALPGKRGFSLDLVPGT